MLIGSTSIFFFLQYTERGKENTSLVKAVSDHMLQYKKGGKKIATPVENYRSRFQTGLVP